LPEWDQRARDGPARGGEQDWVLEEVQAKPKEVRKANRTRHKKKIEGKANDQKVPVLAGQ